ncbi:MAG: PhzF family phenazine biosynthesis protein [Mariniblastus sp.]|nr:PhzF family phenazine biosynthesis protein [Mariniblastus sp.]
MPPKSDIYQVDAFIDPDRPFSGNPAGVCLLKRFPADDWMQSMAAEMNLSETAFVCPGEPHFQLRWFTPTTEVDLCGHATLAAAHALWAAGQLGDDQPILFQTLSGELRAQQQDGLIELDFPAEPTAVIEPPDELLAALSLPPLTVAQNRMDYLVELADEEQVSQVQIDLEQLGQLPVRGLIVTAQTARAGIDFVSRFFAPAVGVDEDPVTGSAHCGLAPYWGDKLNRQTMNAYQVSPRGGQLTLRREGQRVFLRGAARTVFRGALEIVPAG